MAGQRRRGAGLAVLVSFAGLTTTIASAEFAQLLSSDGWGLTDLLLLPLFVVLFFWISIGFWTATFGFAWSLLHDERPAPRGAGPTRAGAEGPLPPTAIVMPVYNEDPRRALANLRAIRGSLLQTGHAAAFDVFVLSDTRDPDIWAEEEWRWAQMRTTAEGDRLFYRRREENVGRKSGNIQEFCQRWGARYRYLVILDADSLMTGETLVEMVCRMEDDPEVGILQVPPALVNRNSLFARLLQFASALYGNVFRSGFTLWARTEGNYWGHNAILRTEAFMRHCGLPNLPGEPPWGGEILSHDFVEAALMLRAGWKVVVASDLGGSYEECPGNLVDFAKRDERWSMGNLQHIPMALAAGMHPVSRFHLGMGAFSYLASPLWALFMLLCLVQGAGLAFTGPPLPVDPGSEAVPARLGLLPLGGALGLLLLVKVWALLAVLRRRSMAAQFGGVGKLVASVLLDTVLSFLLAPILMAFHTTFAINSLLGRKVSWEAQARGEKALSFAEAFRVHAPHTIAGLAVALLATWAPRGLFWWMLPILVGLIFSAPLSVLLSSVRAGRRLRAAGIFLIPEEIAPLSILKRQQLYLAEETANSGAVHPFARLVADPVFLRLHLDLLPRPPRSPMPPAVRERLQRIALSGGPRHLSRAERLLLMQDPDALAWLHREVWKDWPVELLQKVGT